MAGSISQAFLDKLIQRRAVERAAAEALLIRAKTERRQTLTDDEEIAWRAHRATLKALDEHIGQTRSELQRAGSYSLGAAGSHDCAAYGRSWGQRVGEKLARAMAGGTEGRAVISGSVDTPSLVEADVVAIARPARLLDLLVNRRVAPGHAIEYLRQIARDTNAAPVADAALKPTSIYTLEAVQDHVRVLAHLSEETPQRIWNDHTNVQSWLTAEMFGGLADALEEQIISGDGLGENFVGILEAPGTTAVPWDTDPATTLRSAVTALQTIGEQPTAWVVSPQDAAEIDLGRWGTAGGFLTGGFESGGVPSSSNIFGAVSQRVVSNSVPVGTAVLADWNQLALYVREQANLALDASAEFFRHNTFIARAEMRCVSAVLRPSAFAIVDLTAA